MAMSDWLPGADLTQRFDQGKYRGVIMPRVVKGVLHTTETTSWPGYGGGATAPTITARWDGNRLVYRQHFPLNMSARALKNNPGGVNTNTLECLQIELVGTCSESYYVTYVDRGAIYWPRAPKAAKTALRDLMRLIEAHTQIPRQSYVRWKSYNDGRINGSYGASNGVRLTAQQWVTYRGWLGHQHVPEGNTHGDPGDLDIAFLLNVTGPYPAPSAPLTPSLEDDLTPEEHAWLGNINSVVAHIRDLHAYISARKAGRSDEDLTRDELLVAKTITRDDIPSVADEMSNKYNLEDLASILVSRLPPEATAALAQKLSQSEETVRE